MDGSHLAHLLRRSRLRSFAAGPGHVDILAARSPNESLGDNVPRQAAEEMIERGVDGVLEKRQAILDSNNPHVHSGAGVAASSTKAVGTAIAQSTQRQAAQAATVGTTRTTVNVVETQTRAATSASAKATLEAVTSSSRKTIDFGSATTSSSATPQTSATPSTTSTSPSSSATPSTTSTSAAPSTTSRTSISTTSTTTFSSTSSSASVRAITSTISTSSANPTSTLDAAKAGSSSSGMSTGAVVGVALGAIVGLVVVGSFIGWLYRKWTARSYNSQAPWSKIDDDITPFPHNGSNEKFERYTDGNDDIYGGSAAPVIGSRRALAMARDNAFNHDGSLRDSAMYDRGDNRAGVGAGGQPIAYSPYPQFSPDSGAAYGLDAQGRPYNGQAGRTPMLHTYENQYVNDSYYDNSPPPNSRQLVGVNAHPYADVPMPTPVPMGRPAAPSTAAEFAQMEDFADEPEPLTPGLAYTFDEPHTPTNQTAASDGRVAGRSRVSMTTPQAPRVLSPTESVQAHDYIPAPPLAVPPPAASSTSSASLAPMPLPQFAPLSPLMNDFDFKRRSQPLPMYEDEASVQKRMYGEVANTAGISEPVTPASAQPSPNLQSGLNDSTNSAESSFSATAPHADISGSTLPSSSSLPRLPEFTLAPPQPYQHGQPLSPLNEVPTPLSTASTGEPLLNPFDLPTPRLRAGLQENQATQGIEGEALAPPFSASTSGATGFPSPAYPPPSPGGMSVPGSVTDSPRRWDSGMGTPKGRAVSVNYDEEDAYGGI
ncbi:hypothetical protein I317_04592 [Kwoniella heveanensis CBS 569]|nr:hypothetical protein I317_04592 [Kwoniella heveanensis CBS 569]